MTPLLNINVTRLKNSAGSAYPILIGLLVASIPATAITMPIIMYYSALILFVLGVLTALFKQQTFTTTEWWIIIAWLTYPALVACDLLLRAGWNWSYFQDSSRFLIGIPIFLLVRKYGFPIVLLFIGVGIGAVWAGSMGLYQKFFLLWPRSYGGTSGGEISFGNISLLLAFLALAMSHMLNTNNKIKLVIGMGLFAFGIIGSITSGTKGGWMSSPFLMWALLSINPTRTNITKLKWMISFFVVCALIWWLSPHIQSRVNHIPIAVAHYFETGAITDGSASFRLELWKAALYIIKDNILLGSGTQSYAFEMNTLINKGIISSKVAALSGPHNQYLNLLVQYGILGLVSLLSIYITALLHCTAFKKHNPVLAICGIIIVLGYLDFNLVDNMWGVNTGGVFFVVMVAIISAYLSHLKYKPAPIDTLNNLAPI